MSTPVLWQPASGSPPAKDPARLHGMAGLDVTEARDSGGPLLKVS